MAQRSVLDMHHTKKGKKEVSGISVTLWSSRIVAVPWEEAFKHPLGGERTHALIDMEL